MTPRTVFLPSLLLLVAMSSVRGEVAVIPRATQLAGQIIVQSNPVGPDPIVQSWSAFLNLDPDRILNPGGDAAGDMAPAIGTGVPSGSLPPTFVWARLVSPGNHDPVYAQYLGDHWSSWIVIASDAADDRDPQLWQDAYGTIHAAWWRVADNGAQDDTILYASREAGSPLFSSPEVVSLPGESARKPRLTVDAAGQVFIAYERSLTGQGTAIVVASKVPPQASFEPVTLTMTTLPEGTAPQAIAAAGHRFAVWTDAPDRVGYSELVDGVWSSPAYEPCSGPEDVERARLAVKAAILSQ